MSNNESLHNLRHSTAHLLAAAVLELFPNTKRAIGPAIETGFYYDFEFINPISEEEFPTIEKKMAEILKTWKSFDREEITIEETRKKFKDEPYKLEMAEEFAKNGEKLTVYKSGEYEDLCEGGHSDDPQKEIGAFKLLSVAGAYWRGDEKNKMLARIYGTAFPTEKELDEYLQMLEERLAIRKLLCQVLTEQSYLKFQDTMKNIKMTCLKSIHIIQKKNFSLSQ